jgi:hypothetical protein
MSGLPWSPARPGNRCTARMRRESSPVRYGRCELRRKHDGEAHALEYGMYVVRWDDGPVWVSDDKPGQLPVDEGTTRP